MINRYTDHLGHRVHPDNAKFRMSVYEEHKLDCLGCCEPIDWPTFKKLWTKHNGQWMDVFLEAGKLAGGTD